MQNGQPWDEFHPDTGEINLELTANFLREQNADIIFLQEVERGHEGGKQITPPPHHTRLRELLQGYDEAFAYPRPNKLEIPFGLGLAIFSKTKLRDFQRVDLPPPDLEFKFGGKTRRPSHRLLIAATTIVEGRSLRLLNTHLQAFFMIGASSADHRAQRDRVEAELRKQTGPTLLAGDMNSAPGEGLIEQFAAAGFQTVQNDVVTWKRKPLVLDHIFHNPHLRVENHTVIPTQSSDHHAVRAEFSFVHC